MKLAAELEAGLREFASAGPRNFVKMATASPPLSKLSWHVRGSDEKLLLDICSEQNNLTRRVLATTDHSNARLVLDLERFGRSRPDRLEFVRIEFERSARELLREELRERLKGLLACQFRDKTVESARISADLSILSPATMCADCQSVVRAKAVLATPDGESQDTIHNCRTFALLWMDRLCNRTTVELSRVFA